MRGLAGEVGKEKRETRTRIKTRTRKRKRIVEEGPEIVIRENVLQKIVIPGNVVPETGRDHHVETKGEAVNGTGKDHEMKNTLQGIGLVHQVKNVQTSIVHRSTSKTAKNKTLYMPKVKSGLSIKLQEKRKCKASRD